MIKINLGRIYKTKPHLLADTAEILCMSNGGPVAHTDVIGLITGSVAPAEEAMNADEPDQDDDGLPDKDSSATKSERNSGYAEDCFMQLEYRAGAFGSAYPFEVDGLTLRLKKTHDPLHCLYFFLLCASRNRSFQGKKGLTQSIADYFEVVSKDALARMMPNDADVVMFGPNSADRATRFDTNLRQALPMLAKFMGINMAPEWNPDDEQAQGDASIDLVGVQRLDAWKGGWNLFLGQCAAQELHQDWKRKRSEADLDYHSARFHSTVRAQAVLFVPGCFRQANGDWADKNAAANVILMDRLRIISVIQEGDPSVAGSCWFLQELGFPVLIAQSCLDLAAS